MRALHFFIVFCFWYLHLEIAPETSQGGKFAETTRNQNSGILLATLPQNYSPGTTNNFCKIKQNLRRLIVHKQNRNLKTTGRDSNIRTYDDWSKLMDFHRKVLSDSHPPCKKHLVWKVSAFSDRQ